jgi:hypothetical protein
VSLALRIREINKETWQSLVAIVLVAVKVYDRCSLPVTLTWSMLILPSSGANRARQNGGADPSVADLPEHRADAEAVNDEAAGEAVTGRQQLDMIALVVGRRLSEGDGGVRFLKRPLHRRKAHPSFRDMLVHPQRGSGTADSFSEVCHGSRSSRGGLRLLHPLGAVAHGRNDEDLPTAT